MLSCSSTLLTFHNFPDTVSVKSPDSLSDSQKTVELSKDFSSTDELKTEKISVPTAVGKGRGFVPQSAVALRCRVMPPPCISNPYIKDALETDLDPFGSWRTKYSGCNFCCFTFSITIIDWTL